MKCRACGSIKLSTFMDLGHAPPSNFLLNKQQLDHYEKWYPLNILVCNKCYFVQTKDYFKPEEIFHSEYPYFSSNSSTFLEHSKNFINSCLEENIINKKSFVVEIASNDGYLLQFLKKLKIKNLGIEPTKSTADYSIKKGIPTINDFFTTKLSREIDKKYGKSDLIIANNVIAHIPDINDFIKGVKVLLNKEGIFTAEFQHLYNIIKYNQYDTLYHEHYSYLSLIALNNVIKSNNLKIFRVKKIPTHGGSLRVYISHSKSNYKIEKSFNDILNEEKKLGLNKINSYLTLKQNFLINKLKLLEFLTDLKLKNKKVIAYGAASKGNTMLNYCGIKNDLINFVVDKSESKVGKFLPGSHIRIKEISEIKRYKPDYIIIFPWNLIKEIKNELIFTKSWNCKLVTYIPKLKIHIFE